MIVLFPSHRATVEVFMASDGWRYRAKSANGEILHQSESYTRRVAAERAAIALTETKFTFKKD